MDTHSPSQSVFTTPHPQPALTSPTASTTDEPPQNPCDQVLRIIQTVGQQGFVTPTPPANEQPPQVVAGTQGRVMSQPSVQSLSVRKDKKGWVLSYEGMSVQLKNTKGAQYITFLLDHPGQEFHALNLVTVTDKRPRLSHSDTYSQMSEAQLAEQGLQVTSLLNAQAYPDRHATMQYRRRLEELGDALQDAHRHHDPEQAATLQAEIDAITAELRNISGLRSRGRNQNEAAERARKAVSNRIRTALLQIQDAHPSLGRHLSASLRTGTFCSYTPPPSTPGPGTSVHNTNFRCS